MAGISGRHSAVGDQIQEKVEADPRGKIQLNTLFSGIFPRECEGEGAP